MRARFRDHVGTGRDDGRADRLAGVLDRVERAVDPRLDVQLPGRRDEEEDVAVANELHDAGAELQARLVEILADVREPPVAHAAVGVVRDDRDPAPQRLRRRLVERPPIDHRHGDAVGAGSRSPVRIAATISPTSLRVEPVHS